MLPFFLTVGAAGFEPATSRTRTQWSKTPTADLTDPCFREGPHGSLFSRTMWSVQGG